MKYKTEICYLIFLMPLYLLTPKVSAFQSKENLSLDSSIQTGELPNGLSYYLKEIPDASEKLNMSLVVKVGHNHQEKGENQFAHIVEHLGLFAGKNISMEKSSNLLDEIGLRFGEFNGYTWNDYTDFKMVVPGDNKKAIDIGLLLFEDIIWNLELTERTIDKERIAVFNESNMRPKRPTLFMRSLERRMIGYEELSSEEDNIHLKTFNPEAIIQFYKKWYRPDNMAIVIVGNIKNLDSLEKEIRRRFTKPTAESNLSSEKNLHRDFLLQEPRFLKEPLPQRIEEPARMRAIINFFVREEAVGSKNSIDGMKTNLTRKLFLQIMNRRHREKQENYNADFTVRTELAEPPFALKSVIQINGNSNQEVLKEIIKGFVEVVQNGFSLREFNDAKQYLIQSISSQDTSSIFYWRNNILSQYVKGEALPENKKKLEQSLIQKLTLEDFNRKVRDYLKDQPDVILAAHPGHPLLSYSENDLRQWFSYFYARSIPHYRTPHIPTSLIDSLSLSLLDEVPYTKLKTKIPLAKAYELENGFKIILRSTSKTSTSIGENKQIHFQGYGKTGLSDFRDQEFFSVMNAPAIAVHSGVGELDKFELKRFLTANDFKGNVRPYIGYSESGIRGAASIEEMETAFQLMYLYLSAPNFSETAFQDWKKNEIQSLANQQDINREDFLNVIRDSLMHQEFLPKGTKALHGLRELDLKKVKEMYSVLFGNPGDFTLLISGDFEEQKVLDLCRKYLGNLPFSESRFSSYNSEQMDLVEHQDPSSTIVPSTKPMELAKVRLVYVPKEEISDFDWKDEIKLEILRRSLTELLMRRLRFESPTGGTYLAGAGRYNSTSYNHHEIFLSFDCKPEDLERLVTESKEVVSNLTENVPEEKLFNKIKMSMISKNKGAWNHQGILKKMYDFERLGKEWVGAPEKQVFLNSVTPHDILITAKKYLSNNPYEFVMMPK